MKLRIILGDRDQAILVGDEDDNDIAEFYHNEHATVGQSYETALALAHKLVETSSWECGARKQGTAAGNDPADCNWPVCGCDPYADKIISALQEMGLLVNAADQVKQIEWGVRLGVTLSVRDRVIEAFSGRCEFAPNGCDCEDHCKRALALTQADQKA